MTMFPRAGRGVGALLAAAAVAIGVAGCAGAVAQADVATTIKAKLDERGLPAGAVRCPDDLKAEVGRSVRCEFEVDGQPVDAIATVTTVKDSVADYDITTAARPVAEALLDRKLSDQVGRQLGVTVDSARCSGDLPPEIDKSVICMLTGGSRAYRLRVTVTSVEGGLINFSYAEL